MATWLPAIHAKKVARVVVKPETLSAEAVRRDRWMHPLADGAELRVSAFQRGESPLGTVFLLHGFGEFTEKYLACVEQLLARGFAVLTFDWRSQGLSSRYQESQRRGYVRDFDALLDDFDALLAAPELDGLPRPFWLLGHSMGGMLALKWVQRFEDQPDRLAPWAGCMLSAPMLGIYRLPRWFLRSVAQLQVWRGKGADFAWGAGELDPDNNENRITNDERRFEEIMDFLRAEPLLRTHGATWSWLNSAARLMKGSVSRRALKRFPLPMLLISSGQDIIVDADLHKKFAARCTTCEYLYLPDAKHEPLQELSAVQEAVYTAMADFSMRVLAGRPPEP